MGGSNREDFGVGHGGSFQVIEHVLALSVLEPDPSLGVLGRANQGSQQGERLRVLT